MPASGARDHHGMTGWIPAYLIEAARIAKLTGGDEHLMPWDFKRE
jgi:hypothetical protein